MKNYLSTTKGSFRRTSKTKKRLTRLLALLASALLILWIFSHLFAYLGAVVFVPVRVVDTWLSESTGALPTFIRDRNALITERDELLSQLTIHDESTARIAALEAENQSLRSLDATDERIIAGVIGMPGELPYDTLLLDRGSADGVAVGAVVFSGPDRAIGVVEKVNDQSALVVLATTPGVESTVYILGPDIYTTAVGIGGGVLQVSVPQGITLEEGQVVILPGASGGTFGTISIIDPRPTRPAQYGYVHTGTPILSTRLVSVSPRAPEPLSFEEAKTVVDAAKLDILQVPVPGDVLIDVSSSTPAVSTSTPSTTSSVNEE